MDPLAIILDPGLGFAKTGEHNLQLLRDLRQFVQLEFPILVGASRKRFLGQLLADADGAPRPPAGRDAATAALSVLAGQQGVWGVRVHEPRATRDAFLAWEAVRPQAADGFAAAPFQPRRTPADQAAESTPGVSP